MRFDYDSYQRMILLLKQYGYRICGYEDYQKYERCVILRHDVDMNLEKAVEMAELEQKLGVKSVYFVLLTSDFYNLASLKSQKLLGRIKECGHEIGLHFDEVRYGTVNDVEQINKYIEYEIGLLAAILGNSVNTVSMHRPSKWILGAELNLQNHVINSYSEEYFENFKYVSDSRRNWREDILKIIEEQKYAKLHILTHPIWYNKKEKEMKEVLFQFVERAKQERYDILNENLRDLEEVLNRKEI